MKKVIFTCILLFVLGTAWLLYLEHETERFVENLPKPPSVDTQPDTAEILQPGEDEAYLSEELPFDETPLVGKTSSGSGDPELQREFDETPLVGKEPSVVTETPTIEEIETIFVEALPEEPAVTKHIDDTDAFLAEQTPEEVIPPVHVHGEHCQTSPARYWNGMPEAELYEKLKGDLIARFGDIPEVHIYLRHTLNRNPTPITVEEAVEYFQAVATLYPHQQAFMEEQIARLEAARDAHESGQDH